MHDGRQQFLGDQVFGDGEEAAARVIADQALAVLPHHERGRHGRVHARRGVDPVVGLHAFVDLADDGLLVADLAVWDTGLGVRIGIVADGVAASAEGFPGGVILVGMRDASAHFGEQHPHGGAFDLRHGNGGLIVQRDGDGRGAFDNEEIVLTPDAVATLGAQRFGDPVLEARCGRALAGEIDQFREWGRLRKRDRREEQKRGEFLHSRQSVYITSKC